MSAAVWLTGKPQNVKYNFICFRQQHNQPDGQTNWSVFGKRMWIFDVIIYVENKVLIDG